MANWLTFFVSFVSFVVAYIHKAGSCSSYCIQYLFKVTAYERNELNEQSPAPLIGQNVGTEATAPPGVWAQTGCIRGRLGLRRADIDHCTVTILPCLQPLCRALQGNRHSVCASQPQSHLSRGP